MARRSGGPLPRARAALPRGDRQRHRIRSRQRAHPRGAAWAADPSRRDRSSLLRRESAAGRAAAYVAAAHRM